MRSLMMFELDVDERDYLEINEKNREEETRLIRRIYTFIKDYMAFIHKRKLKFSGIKINVKNYNIYKEVKIYKKRKLLFKVSYGDISEIYLGGYRPKKKEFFNGYINYNKIFELEEILYKLKADYESVAYDSYKKELEKKEVLTSIRDTLNAMEAI